VLVTINNKEIQVDEGSLILDVARDSGFHIPTFCYHAKLSKLGSCRMCLVEIEGMKKLQPSCVTPVMDGMKIQTESPTVVKARKSQLEFLLVNHPLDCPVCDQAGECDLQDLTYKFGNTEGRYRWTKRTFPKRDMGQVITKEMNRCIACRRCSRYCSEISGDYAISEFNRGNHLEMGTFCHAPAEGEFLGNTIQLCPVGALTSSHFRFNARVWDLKGVETICPHCSVGCSITSESKNNKIRRNNATEDKGVTEISICDRGRFGHFYLNSDKRITTPLIKEGGFFFEVTWEKAFDYAADRLSEIIRGYGSDSIGGITSGFCSNEDNYAFQKLFRKVIGTNNIDSCKSYSPGPDSMLRLAAMKGGVKDVKESDLALVLGSSVGTETPILSMNAGIASRINGARLITVTAGENRLLKSKPDRMNYRTGHEAIIVAALIKSIISRKSYSKKFAKEKQDQLEIVNNCLKDISFKEVEKITGIAGSSFDLIAEAMANASKGVILFGDDFLYRSDVVINALHTLGEVAGFNGEKGKIIYAPAAANFSGTFDMGVSPYFYSGHEKIGSKRAAEKNSRASGYMPPQGKGLSWSEMVNCAMEGDLKSLYIMDADLIEFTNDMEMVRDGLDQLDFVIFQGVFMTETAKFSDIVFPSSAYTEKMGSVTNFEGRVQKTEPSVPKSGGPREGWQIIQEIARRMGDASCCSSVDEISEEIADVVIPYGDVTLKSIPRDGIFADYSKIDSLPVKFDSTGLAIDDLVADKDYPLYVVPGKDVFLTQGRGLFDEGLMKISPVAKLLVSEIDGNNLGLVDGELVELETLNGNLCCAVKVTENVAEGVVVVPVNRPDLDAGLIFRGSGVGTRGRLTKRA